MFVSCRRAHKYVRAQKFPMKKPVVSIFLLICAIQCVNSIVTDKEYASLPPVFELDNFDRCMLLGDEALYCYMEFHVQPLDYTDTSITWQKIEELSKNHRNYRHDILRHGICVPFTCPSIKLSHKDPKFNGALAECYSKKYENMGLYGTIGEMSCQTNEPRKFDYLDIAALIFFIAYALFVIYASFYEGLARYKSPEEYRIATTGTTTGKILTCFSIPYNWKRLAKIKYDDETEAFKPIQGIRFYNFVIITITHALMAAMLLTIGNTKWSEQIPDKFATIFFSSGPLAVQTNFLLSSFLLTYHIFKNFNGEKSDKFNVKTILVICFHRYLRLVPSLAIIILFQSTLMYHVGNSPLWDSVITREKEYCRENGWTNLLFINNLINPDRMCFVETWYTAVDMHGFLLVLLILYFTVKNPERMFWIVPSVWVVLNVLQAKRLADNNIYTFYQADPEKIYLLRGIYEKNGIWQHTMPADLSHTGGVLVGIIAGYLFYKYRGQRIFTKTIHVVLWWIFTFGLCLSLVIFPGLWIFSKSYYPSKMFSSTYYTISPALFPIGVSIGIFGFAENVGWLACSVLRWKPIYFLGKLTYSAFLVHYPYIHIRKGLSRKLEYLSDYNLGIQSIELIVVSLMLGLILCLTVELPTSAIQSLLLRKNEEVENEKKTFDRDKEKIL